MSVHSKMTALADEVRELSGTTTPKSLDAMTTDVGVANTEISEQTNLIAQIATALEGKAGASGGVVLPTLSNPASTSDILSGKEAINGSGNKITGTIETKTSNNLTASGATVTVPAGYYASQVTKSVATATQATPSVSINSSGLITASATQTAGYVSAGTKSGTKQLTTQAAKTVTPTTSEQTAVASGVYTTGAIKVGAIPSTYENVATETSDYTTKLTSLGAAITALETELAGKASGGSGGAIQTANVLTHTMYNSTLFYVGSNGITSISNQANATVAMCIPSICFAKAPAAGFAATIYDGDCSMEFTDLRIAIFFVTGDASIIVPGYDSGPADGGA